MDAVFNQIVERGAVPTRQDITDLLQAIGQPGKRQDDKRAAVERLFVVLGQPGTNAQGHHVVETLTSYEAY